MVILENIDIDIVIDKAILQNIDIDKISNRFKFGISNRATLPSCSQIVEIGRSTPWNLYCTSLAPWHERLNNSFLQLLQLWRATYISNIDENIIIEKRQLTFPILNLFFVHCLNDYTQN